MNDYGANEPNPSAFDDRGRWYEAARQQVQGPGTALQWFGLISVLLGVALLVLVLISPDTAFKWLFDMAAEANRQKPPEERKPLPPYNQFVQEATLESLVLGVMTLLVGLCAFFGGSQMKQLRGYGWAVAASALSVLPLTMCCCCGAPVGAWGLIVLLSADVRLAFSRPPVTLLE